MMGVRSGEGEQGVMQQQQQQNIGLQTSRSSSKLARVPKKLWKSRAKSQSRLSSLNICLWIPEGNFRWKSSNGNRVTLQPVSLLQLSEIERAALQQVALARLRALNITCDVPKEVTNIEKPKRRPALLRRKAATTSSVERGDLKDSSDIQSENLVFGVPLKKCIQNDRVLRMGSSRRHPDLSVTGRSESLGDTLEDRGSAESLLLRNGSQADAASVSSTEEKPSLKSILHGTGPQVPNIVNCCFKHIENYGMQTLGIFRVSSSKKRVRQLREDFDSGQDVQLTSDHHPHDVAQLLKEYFRDLPEPLLTRDLYLPYINTLRLRPVQQLEAQRFLTCLLPVSNRDSLWALLKFLISVVDNAEDRLSNDRNWIQGNKMDANNLGTLFGPNILRMAPTRKGKEFFVENNARAEERSDVILVVRNLIENYKKIFEVHPEDMDAVYRRLQVADPEALDTIMRWRYHIQIEADLDADDADETTSLRSSSSVRSGRVPCISVTDEGASIIRPLTLSEDGQSRTPPEIRPSQCDGTSSRESNVDERSKSHRRERIRYSIEVNERKNRIEKSASASSLQHSQQRLLQLDERNSSSPECRQQETTPPRTLTSILISDNSQRRRSRASNSVSSSVRFQNERWKRWEIIASEYTEQGTLN